MSSPKTLDFPLPPRRASITFSPDLRSPPPSQFPSFAQQQQLNKILDLTNRYRKQAVTLLARQEALQAEQKNVFELERQLWITEREIWDEERRILSSGPSNIGLNGDKKELNAPVANGSHPVLSPTQQHHATRFLSISSMAESQHDHGVRGRESSGGGSGIGWFLKQGTPTAAGGPLHNEGVSPKGSRPRESPKFGSISEMSLAERSISEEAVEDDELAEIPQALISEATKLVYGDRAVKRASFSSSGTTKRPVLFTTLSENSTSDQKSVRRVSSSATVKYPTSKNAQYLAAFSDEDHSDDERDVQISQPPRLEKRQRKRSASYADKTSEEPPIPLRLRPASNFGTAFGASFNSNSLKVQQTLQPPRSGSIHATFYHPETPIDSFNSQHSFRDTHWNSNNLKPIDNSVGGHSTNSNLTVKPGPQAINVKSTPWGATSTSVTSPLTSPTFGKEMNHGLKPPPSPSNITSSLSISSGAPSLARVQAPLGDTEFSGSRYSPEDEDDVVEIQTNGLKNGVAKKGKTSPPTYTWAPPRPISPTRSTDSSQRSGLYGNTILLSPSTVAPSMKTANPRLSAVGGIPPFSPTMGRMGTSSMLLSVSSRSENGDDEDEDELDSEDEGRNGSLNGKQIDPRVHSTTSMEVPMRLGGGVLPGMPMTMGANGVMSPVRTVDGYVEPPIEVVKDNSRWGDVMPGGMI